MSRQAWFPAFTHRRAVDWPDDPEGASGDRRPRSGQPGAFARRAEAHPLSFDPGAPSESKAPSRRKRRPILRRSATCCVGLASEPIVEGPADMQPVFRRFGGFAVAGFSGFVVDAGLTEALAGFGVSPYLGRIPAWRFPPSPSPTPSSTATSPGRTARAGTRPAGTLPRGIACFDRREPAWCSPPPWRSCPLRPLLAVAAGTGVGMVMNFAGYLRFVFKTGEDQAA